MMFGLGVWEIGLICVAVLVFVRPEELPRVMGKLGSLYGRVTGSSRRIMRQLQAPFELPDDPLEGEPGNSIAADNGRERPAPGDGSASTPPRQGSTKESKESKGGVKQ